MSDDPSTAGIEAPGEAAGLIDYILARYHDVHRRELQHLVRLARESEVQHQGGPGAMVGLADLLERIFAEVESHMQKEEQILFPLMRAGGHPMIGRPIAQMRHEHDEHMANIAELEAITQGGALPEPAEPARRELYAGLSKFIEDLKQHILLENERLFPQFAA